MRDPPTAPDAAPFQQLVAGHGHPARGNDSPPGLRR